MPIHFILPRFIRFRDAPAYLGMDKNRFRSQVKPFITEIPIGKQGIAYDRLDLDRWADHYKEDFGRPISTDRGELWVKTINESKQGSTKEENIGTLIRRSTDREYRALLARKTSRKPAQS